MNKTMIIALIFSFTATPAFASSVATDRGFEIAIAKYVSKETAQEALKVATRAKAEFALAKSKKKKIR